VKLNGQAAGEATFVVIISGALMVTGYIAKVSWVTLLASLTAWIIASAFLYLKGKNWSVYGFKRPRRWPRVLLTAAGGTIGLHILIGLLLKPWITQLTGESVDLSQFEAVRGNPAALLIGLAAVWTEAAFIEEMVFRGFFLNRIADVFFRSRTGWLAGCILSSVLFGLGHQYQGISGMILTGMAGLYFAGIYFIADRNLITPVLVHGLYDTSAFILLYFA
jgi:uncharacterized protein